MKSLPRLLLYFIAAVLPCQTAEANRCYRTTQNLHSTTGWNHGCYTCHPGSNTQHTNITKSYTYDGDDYRHGVMLGIVKNKQKSANFIAEAQALGLTAEDLGGLGDQYGNARYHFNQLGKTAYGSSYYTNQQGTYGVSEQQFGSPADDTAIVLNLVARITDAASSHYNTVAPHALSITDRYIAGTVERQRIATTGDVLARALIASRASPSTTTQTNNYTSTTTPNGEVTVERQPGPPKANPPDQFGNGPLGNQGGRQLGVVPDAVVQNCNQCHVEQKRLLIGPNLSPDQRLDAIRRVLSPPEDPAHMPKKPHEGLSDEAGARVLKYLTEGK